MSSVVRSLSTLQEPSLFEMLSSAFVYRASFKDHSCGFVDIPILCQCHYERGCVNMVNININVVNRKWNINCITTWLFLLHIIDLFILHHCLYYFDKQYITFVLTFLSFLQLCCNPSLHQLPHQQATSWPWFNLVVPIAFIRLRAWLMPVMQPMYASVTIVTH